MAAWYVVVEFLSRVLKIIVTHHSSYCWAGCSRSSSCAALLIQIVIVCRCEWWRFEQELHAHRGFLVVDPRCHEFIRTNLSAPPTWRVPVDVWSSDIFSRIRGNASRWDQSHMNIWHEVLDWYGPSCEVIVQCPVMMYYAIEIDSSLFLSGCPRCGYVISIYSRVTAS
jgi:hypothetical protein